MLRRILLAAVAAAAVGFATFWWLTIPAEVPSNLFPAHTPNLANGLTAFNAGGCSSCHAVPGQPDRLRLGGGHGKVYRARLGHVALTQVTPTWPESCRLAPGRFRSATQGG